MRSLGSMSVAAALCVCCVLPSYDAVDKLPSEGQGATSSGAGSSNGGKSNLTSPSGGGKTSNSGGSDDGEGGDGTSGTDGSGGTDSGGSGGMTTTGGTPNAGASPGGSGGNAPVGGMGGAPATGGMGGAPVGGAPGGTGGGGAGGTMNGKPECDTFCDGNNGLVVRCQGNLAPVVASEAGCQTVCNGAPAASLSCWQMHLNNVITGLPASVHCSHASGEPGNGVCPNRQTP